MTIKNVPVGSYYVVEETEAHGYTPKATNEEGSVEENGAKVEFVNTFNAPKTGDESKIGLGFAAFSVSAVVALAVVAAKKRREAK